MEKKMNNKGFSLVELIIVIAIMAILVAVLAPQYLKYVERSRNSTDIDNATEIVTALQVWASETDPATGETLFKSGDTGTVAIAAAGSASSAPTGSGASALKNAGIDVSTMNCKSTQAWTAYSIAYKVNADGTLEFTYTATGDTAGEFAKKMGNATKKTEGGN